MSQSGDFKATNCTLSSHNFKRFSHKKAGKSQIMDNESHFIIPISRELPLKKKKL